MAKSPSPPTCSKCSGAMTPGFLLDFTGDGVRRDQSLWVEGSRQAAPWVGTRLKGKKVREVDAYRCDSCGFLELYAHTLRNDFLA